MKQSATDPLSGRIDVSILTTGMSSTARRRRNEVGLALRALLKTKTQPVIPYQKLYIELREGSELVSSDHLKIRFCLPYFFSL